MKDRIATNPGRVQLVPVAGQTNVYDMTMADNPTEQGTALNKANLLTDATAAAIAAAFMSSSPDTPNEALAALAVGCSKIEWQSYIGTGVTGAGNKNSVTFQHEPKLVLILGNNYATSSSTIGIFADLCAVLPWEDLKATTASSFSHFWKDDTSYPIAVNFTLSSDYKTLEWWYAYGGAASNQFNAQVRYHVVSFY